MTWKGEARAYMEKAGVDPDVFDYDIPALMADFAQIKVGEMLEPLQGILDIGKRDLSNPKYDGYFESARIAIQKARGQQ